MRKGSVMDIFPALVILLIASLSLIIYAFASSTIMTAFVNNFQNDTRFNASALKAQAYTTNTFNTFNYGFLFLYFGILASIAILDYYVYVNPLFFPFTIIIMVISIFFAMFIANIYWAFCQASSPIQAICNQFNIVTFIMKNLPFFGLVYCIIISLVMYMAKGRK